MRRLALLGLVLLVGCGVSAPAAYRTAGCNALPAEIAVYDELADALDALDTGDRAAMQESAWKADDLNEGVANSVDGMGGWEPGRSQYERMERLRQEADAILVSLIGPDARQAETLEISDEQLSGMKRTVLEAEATLREIAFDLSDSFGMHCLDR